MVAAGQQAKEMPTTEETCVYSVGKAEQVLSCAKNGSAVKAVEIIQALKHFDAFCSALGSLDLQHGLTIQHT